jgi:hypothetical protein
MINLKNGGRTPLTYQSFLNIAGEPPAPLTEEYSVLPPIGDTRECELFSVPKLEELGYGDISQVRAEATLNPVYYFVKSDLSSC